MVLILMNKEKYLKKLGNVSFVVFCQLEGARVATELEIVFFFYHVDFRAEAGNYIDLRMTLENFRPYWTIIKDKQTYDFLMILRNLLLTIVLCYE